MSLKVREEFPDRIMNSYSVVPSPKVSSVQNILSVMSNSKAPSTENPITLL